jgi:hypothetical protein
MRLSGRAGKNSTHPKHQNISTKTCTQMFTAAGVVVAKKWNNPNVHQQMNG